MTHHNGSLLLRPGSHDQYNDIITYVGNVNIDTRTLREGQERSVFFVIFVLLVIISLCQDGHSANTTFRFLCRYVASVNWAQNS